MCGWTAIHSLLSRPSGGAAHLTVVPPCFFRTIVAGEASCRCSPTNADEAPLVRSIQSASVVLGCWPIRTRRLRTQRHQGTNTTNVSCWDAKVLGCVPVLCCVANLRGLPSSFSHDWATAALLHVSIPVLVHSILRVATAAKEPALVRWLAVVVCCGDCCRDQCQRAPNLQLQTFAHTVVGRQPSLAYATAHRIHHQLAYLVDRGTLETHSIGLVGCVVVRLFGGANLVQRLPHALFLERRAQNLHRIRHRSRQYFRHPTARERANEASHFAPCCSRECH
jgi:hypothetical protein